MHLPPPPPHQPRPPLGSPSALPSGGAHFPSEPRKGALHWGQSPWLDRGEGPSNILLSLISVFEQTAEEVRAPQWVWRPR